MNAPRLPDDRVAQAVYTWSRKRLDGTVGMGFCAISSSLVGSIDWLGRLDPAEFGLFQGNVTGLPEELYEARKGFSEVGRMLVDDVAIVYRKTADGENSQASSRPHQVVHALLGDPAVLKLSCVTRVRDDFWIRKVDGSASDLGLTDLTLADVTEVGSAPAGHSCPGDHQGAEDVLRAVVAGRFEREGTIELADRDDVLASVALAFPEEVTNNFSLIPYVVVSGVRRELVIRLPTGTRPAEVPRRSATKCSLERAVERSASQFLYGSGPSLSRYAEMVLKPHIRPTPAAPPRTPFQWSAPTASEPGANPVYALIEEVREGREPLTDAQSKALLGKLVADSVSAEQVLEIPSGTLAEMFGEVSDGDVIWEWSRKLFADVSATAFIELWNRTRIAAFLGVILLKNVAAAQGEGLKISAEKGIAPEVTSAILRRMKRFDGGGRSIGRIITWGFGDSEPMREFIAETFREDPHFLFGSILKHAEIPASHMADYIRSCFEPWAAYRRLPERESAAIYQVLRLTFLQRLKVLIGR